MSSTIGGKRSKLIGNETLDEKMFMRLILKFLKPFPQLWHH